MSAAAVVNPLREGIRLERTPEPCVMVIFGASGDLTRRKLIPALYDLARDHMLPAGFSVVGFSRTDLSNDAFRDQMRKAVEQFGANRHVDPQAWDQFAQGLWYVPAHPAHPEDYQKLAKMLEQVDRQRGTSGNRVYYLALPPSSVPDVIHHLHSTGLAQSDKGWTRVVVEKPFGRDLETAQALNRELAQVFREEQVYRIDHYLGKETVQNLLVFRFANGIFEPVWNRRYVEQVQITAAESVGVENRASYYEEAGALRDMVQNHMLQLLSLTAMEPPLNFGADAVRQEKIKALRSIRPITEEETETCVVRGQYGPGWVNGKQVPSYRSEPGVNPKSATETYVALKLYLENWRWAGVPFYLRAGKRLPKRATEIAIQFRQPPLRLFESSEPDAIAPNLLVMRIQPDEGISLKFQAKRPGPAMHVRPVNMDFRYATSFGEASADAYSRLLLDCMLGDPTLFASDQSVEASWALVDPIERAWAAAPAPAFPNYASGSWGPAEADKLMEGGAWREL